MITAEELRGQRKLLAAARRRIGHRECSPICDACRLFYKMQDYVSNEARLVRNRIANIGATP